MNDYMYNRILTRERFRARRGAISEDWREFFRTFGAWLGCQSAQLSWRAGRSMGDVRGPRGLWVRKLGWKDLRWETWSTRSSHTGRSNSTSGNGGV